MKTAAEIYNESRNGANGFYQHPLVRSFRYTDGVQEFVEAAACYWLLDIVATECAKPLRATGAPMGIIEVAAAGGKAALSMTVSDDAPPIWTRQIDWTDMPEGQWKFFLADEGGFALILPSEY